MSGRIRTMLRGAPRADAVVGEIEHRASAAHSALSDAGVALAGHGERLLARGERMLDTTEHYARREPVKALGIAMAVGAIAMLILTSTRPTRGDDR
jgi:ElaB/YqjD/DUF883 family membrane-anchored ribosome-binding protein